MPNEFWTILGRLCCSENFRTTAMAKSVPYPVSDWTQLTELRDYLVAQGFHPNRYQVSEIDRMLQYPLPSGDKLGESTGPFATLRQEVVKQWRPEPTEWVVWEILGLCSIDHQVRERLTGAAGQANAAEFATALAESPGFVLSEPHVGLLRELFRQETVFDALTMVETFGWKIPDIGQPAACDGGFVMTNAYIHFSQEEVYALWGQNLGVRVSDEVVPWSTAAKAKPANDESAATPWPRAVGE